MSNLPQNEVMIDLETLSTRPHAVILVIGAVKFNRNSPHQELKEMDTFYQKIEIETCKELGMHINKETQSWWDTQDEKIREEAFTSKPRYPLKTVLQNFIKWYGNAKYPWSHGATFDIVILNEAFERCGLSPPWKFWEHRDTRTLFDLARVWNKDLPQNLKHHALHDCYRQICGVKLAIKRLKLKN